MAPSKHPYPLTMVTHIRILLTTWTILGSQYVHSALAVSYSVLPEINSTQMVVINNSTVGPDVLSCDECDYPMGIVIIVAFISFFLGVALTFGCIKWIERRNQRIPPRDYITDATPAVNGEEVALTTTTVNTKSSTERERSWVDSEISGSNPHKKLERLIKPTRPVPAFVEKSAVATPLVLQVTEEEDSEHEYMDPNNPIIISPSKRLPNNNSPPEMYTNVGDKAPLEQPYDELVINPEEVEYENTRLSDYSTPDIPEYKFK